MSDKVHFAGGWTRYRADDSVISQNRLLYIATKQVGGWGIEAAFGVEGHLTGAEAVMQSAAALDALERTMTAQDAGDVDAWLDSFHYPLVIVLAPGQIELYHTRAEMDAAYRDWVAAGLPVSYSACMTAVGPTAALVEQSVTQAGEHFQQTSLIVERDGTWATTAVSAVRPEL